MSDQPTMPTADFDSPWKEALAQFLPDALRLFFPDIHARIDWSRGYTLLDKELQQVTHDADLGRRLADTLVQVLPIRQRWITWLSSSARRHRLTNSSLTRRSEGVVAASTR